MDVIASIVTSFQQNVPHRRHYRIISIVLHVYWDYDFFQVIFGTQQIGTERAREEKFCQWQK